MLAKTHRVVAGADYRAVVRRGRRVAGSSMVTYALRRTEGPARFGFIVGKKVGNAVQRNRVRRRLKACCAQLVGVAGGWDVVIRALPGAAQQPWDTLQREVIRTVTEGLSR